jgi:hypothetical protein
MDAIIANYYHYLYSNVTRVKLLFTISNGNEVTGTFFLGLSNGNGVTGRYKFLYLCNSKDVTVVHIIWPL